MVELGKYAGAVLGAWGVTLALIALLIALTWVQSLRAKRLLDATEARHAERKGR